MQRKNLVMIMLLLLVMTAVTTVAFAFKGTHSTTAMGRRNNLRTMSASSNRVASKLCMGQANAPLDMALLSIARGYVSSGFGLSNPDILGDFFTVSGPSFLQNDGKEAYLSELAKETAALLRAVPDLDLRPYSFTVDDGNSNVVWFKIRPTGTISGPLSYRGEVYLPNQRRVDFPVQQLSVTVEGGRIAKATSAYVIDRFTGNTGGLAGVAGVLHALGDSPNKFGYLPLLVVLRQFFGRNRRVAESGAKISPFPNSVMISLAKQVVSSSFGAADSSLLSDDFVFSGPLVGPLTKSEFVKAFNSFNLKQALPDLETNPRSFEVDLYDPQRVWLISRGSGKMTGPLVVAGRTLLEPTGKEYIGAPEALSVSINEDGLCYKVTVGYVVDRFQGNTRGLGAVYGVLEAIGLPLPFWEKWSFADIARQLREGAQRSKQVPAPRPKVAAPASVKAAAPAPVKVAAPAPVKVAAPAPVKVAAPAPVKAAAPASVKAAAPAPVKVAAPAPVKAVAPAPVKVATPAPVKAAASAPVKVAAPAPVKVAAPAPVKAAAPAPVKAAAPAPVKAAAPAPVQMKKEGGFFGRPAETKVESTPRTASAAAAVKPAPAKQPPPAKAALKPAAVVIATKPVPAPKRPDAPKAAPIAASQKEEKKGGFSFLGSIGAAPAKASARPAANEYSGTLYGSLSSDTKKQAKQEEPKRAPTPAPANTPAKKPEPAREDTKAEPTSLSASAAKKINQVSGDNRQALRELDALVQKYEKGAVNPEGFYRELLKICGGSKDAAFDLSFDLIGSLPRGDKKSRLSQFFSQFL